jgi:hypothetical protein
VPALAAVAMPTGPALLDGIKFGIYNIGSSSEDRLTGLSAEDEPMGGSIEC